jgi:hypothetical protein
MCKRLYWASVYYVGIKPVRAVVAGHFHTTRTIFVGKTGAVHGFLLGDECSTRSTRRTSRRRYTGTTQMEHRVVRKAFADLGLQQSRKMWTPYPRDTTDARHQLFVVGIDARSEVYCLEAPAPPSIALPKAMD